MPRCGGSSRGRHGDIAPPMNGDLSCYTNDIAGRMQRVIFGKALFLIQPQTHRFQAVTNA